MPQVVSVHDVSFLEHPEYFTSARCAQLRMTVRRTVRQAVRVLTGSEFARQSILRAYPVDPDKVVTIPIAANPIFRPLPRDRAQREVRERLKIDGPFVLTVGDLQPRKNHVGLIQAFEGLVQTYPQIGHKLVFAGKDTWFAPQIRDAAKNSRVANRIVFTGFVEDEDLLSLYNACECFVFPSFYEGFGIPILEAMACGRAVACANTASMPEVADGAGSCSIHNHAARSCGPWPIFSAMRRCARGWSDWVCSALPSLPGTGRRSGRWNSTRMWPRRGVSRRKRYRSAVCGNDGSSSGQLSAVSRFWFLRWGRQFWLLPAF